MILGSKQFKHSHKHALKNRQWTDLLFAVVVAFCLGDWLRLWIFWIFTNWLKSIDWNLFLYYIRIEMCDECMVHENEWTLKICPKFNNRCRNPLLRLLHVHINEREKKIRKNNVTVSNCGGFGVHSSSSSSSHTLYRITNLFDEKYKNTMKTQLFCICFTCFSSFFFGFST